MRLHGESYEEIARAGGGIVSTVRATRDATPEALLQSALTRVDALIAEGVGLIEIKSGYGLNRDTELAMLRAARQVAKVRPIRVRTSFLGAHAIPPEYAGRADAYLDEVCLPTLRAAHAEGLVDAVDGFCEGIAFTPDQIERVFRAARDLGLPVKLHAEQLSNIGGTQLAARYGALSADHLEYATDADARAMATSGSVAVLLPGAFYTLRETQTAAGRRFSRAWCSDGGRDRLQPRLVAADLAVAGDEHGLHPVPPDPGRGAGRRHPPRGARAGPDRLRHDRARTARRSGGLGRCNTRRNCATGSGSTRLHARYFGGQIAVTLILTPEQADLAQLHAIWHGTDPVTLHRDAKPAVTRAAALVQAAAASGEAVYGVNTGFGKLAHVKIAPPIPNGCSAT